MVMFAAALESLTRITDADFDEYEVDAEQLADVRLEFADWASSLRSSEG